MPALQATFGDALLQTHHRLLRHLRALRAALGAPPAELAAGLDAVRACLAEHFRFEEENGYLSSVLARHPHMARTVQRLAAEHGELLRGLDELREAARTTLLEAHLAQQVGDWLARVRRHERRENLLVEDAFNLDLGTED